LVDYAPSIVGLVIGDNNEPLAKAAARFYTQLMDLVVESSRCSRKIVRRWMTRLFLIML
jgi:hypothetical protein